MRYRLTAFGIAGTMLFGDSSSMAQALRRDVDRPPVSTLPGIPFPRVVGPTFITQSTATTITPLNSFSCSSSGANTDSSYYRAFTLSAFNPPLDQQEFLVQSVTFGIEAAVGPGNGRAQPATVRIYSSTTNPPTTASLTLLSTENVSIDDQAGTLLTVPLSTTPLLTVATDILVVEVFTPNGAATSSSLIIGSNGLGQAGPSFIKAVDCAIGEITSLAATFPNMHIVMRVDGNSQGQGPDLSITTSNGKDGYFPGETLTYTIAAENLGPVAATGAAVAGSFPRRSHRRVLDMRGERGIELCEPQRKRRSQHHRGPPSFGRRLVYGYRDRIAYRRRQHHSHRHGRSADRRGRSGPRQQLGDRHRCQGGRIVLHALSLPAPRHP